jgi:Recombinase
VRRISRDARDGWTPGQIARALNRDGVPSAQGGNWKPQVVRSILMNPAYVGERYGVRNAHTPIISRRAWNAAQAALAARARAA